MQEADKPGTGDEPREASADHGSERNGGSVGESVRPEVQGKLGDKLREVYSDVMNEPVPDRFLELLAQLDGSPPDPKADDARVQNPDDDSRNEDKAT